MHPEAKGCRICLGRLSNERHGSHAICRRSLFGTTRPPRIEVEPAQLHLLGLEMAGHVTLSGVQRKVALGREHGVLRVSVLPSGYILKPQEDRFPRLPENEHLTLALARRAGFEVPGNGLVELDDGNLALLIERFDRREEGGKVAMEDFCQLSGRTPAEKYGGSAELCARIVQRYSSAPLLDLRELLRLLLFSCWVGNGDLHLKNLSLLTRRRDEPRLSPVHDLLNTSLVIPGDQLALPVGGKRDNLKPETWFQFTRDCGLPPRLLVEAAEKLLDVLEESPEWIGRSFLPEELRIAYLEGLEERGEGLRSLRE